ncbi:hypothetical protein B0I35DRAFT_476833 [Stachybotrys elegans]|uniref:RlpA-like protein double-psi beta-barrel domain-containing protein n=1 Tax=Stachybotrys elegans TaxID=80388 RepID=A0A8K0WU97_9HYPO|nr:hypothetical protein B0I35DRAFT_476833 [Stachybotrys elegans]
MKSFLPATLAIMATSYSLGLAQGTSSSTSTSTATPAIAAEAADTPAAAAAAAPDDGCTSTLVLLPSLTNGPTKTVYARTRTSTATVECGSCVAVQTDHLPLGPGPVVFYTTTVTARRATVETAYVCSDAEADGSGSGGDRDAPVPRAPQITALQGADILQQTVHSTLTGIFIG